MSIEEMEKQVIERNHIGHSPEQLSSINCSLQYANTALREAQDSVVELANDPNFVYADFNRRTILDYCKAIREQIEFIEKYVVSKSK